jgi:hypothetical protein
LKWYSNWKTIVIVPAGFSQKQRKVDWNSPDFVDTFFRCRGSVQEIVEYYPAPENATTTPSRATLLASTPSFRAQAAFRPLRRSYSTGDRYPRLECNLTRL